MRSITDKCTKISRTLVLIGQINTYDNIMINEPMDDKIQATMATYLITVSPVS